MTMRWQAMLRWGEQHGRGNAARGWVWLTLCLWLCLCPAERAGAQVRSDEQVILFPTSAHLDEKKGEWIVPFHGWIYEPEHDSIWRDQTLEGLAEAWGLKEGTARNKLFQQRARWFVVDNERGKTVRVKCGKVTAASQRSAKDGHFEGSFTLKAEGAEQQRAVKKPEQAPAKTEATGAKASKPGEADAADDAGPMWMELQVVLPNDDGRSFVGRVQLLGAEGVSVVSDIDDTIKVTEVTDARKLMNNTFTRPFEPVKGMAAAYRRWAAEGAAFHYVSNSPWQLYPSLAEFIEDEAFPKGDMHLRRFRLKDHSGIKFFTEKSEHKLEQIASLMRRFPGRQFVLVGDCGENDPEIYGRIAGQFPDRVLHIYLRTLGEEKRGDKRLKEAMAKVPADRWTLFDTAEALPPRLDRRQGDSNDAKRAKSKDDASPK